MKLPCPVCQGITEDQGRITDFFGDYSPYLPIDQCKRTDGWIDRKTHICPHQIVCPNCGYTHVEMVQERKL